ncbi:MAG: hypothetical protein MI863_19340 [Desulfobacterales bacterium]|nr:hypothetical protein [Desulfobacterales bacterium]
MSQNSIAKSRYAFLILSVIALSGLFEAAWAGWSHRHHATVDNPSYGDMMRLRDEYVLQAADLRRTIARLGTELEAELASGQADRRKAEDLEKKIASVKMEMAEAKTEHIRTMINKGSDYAAFCREGGHYGPDFRQGPEHGRGHGAAHVRR